MWSNLILEFAAESRIFELELSSETMASSLFTNSNINRVDSTFELTFVGKLSQETLHAILDEMVANGTRHAAQGSTANLQDKRNG